MTINRQTYYELLWLLKDAFQNLHEFCDSIDPRRGEDCRELQRIRKILTSKVICHEKYIISSRLKRMAQKELESEEEQ